MSFTKGTSIGAVVLGLAVLVGPAWLMGQISAGDARADLRPPPSSYTELLRLIKPAAGEAKWEQVPWINLVWEARLKAAAEGKPVFIWAAGGPPGGC